MSSQRHLPNFARWDLRISPGLFVQHRKCGDITSASSGPRTCLKCKRKVGRRATQEIRDRAHPETDFSMPRGFFRRYRWPSAQVEGALGLPTPGDEGHPPQLFAADRGAQPIPDNWTTIEINHPDPPSLIAQKMVEKLGSIGIDFSADTPEDEEPF